MSLENRPGQQSEWVAVDPPELTEDKKLYPNNTASSTNGLLKNLGNLGISLTTKAVLQISNSVNDDRRIGVKIDLFRSTSTQEFTTFTMHTLRYHYFLMDKVPNLHPLPIFPSSKLSDLIADDYHISTDHSLSLLQADMDLLGEPFRMTMLNEPRGEFPYKLNLVIPTHIPQGREVSLDTLPLNFRSVGFTYDLAHYPQHRDILSAIAQKRIPAQVLESDRSHTSSVKGHETPEGINTIIHLYLQDPSPQSFLKCYEVELSALDGKINPDNTEEIVPESHWQEEENHYCMIGAANTSFPLVPVGIDKIARLELRIHYQDTSPDTTSELLGDLPISIDGRNQWFAEGCFEKGKVELSHKPEWGENNAAFVYRQTSSKRISPKEIHAAVVGLSTLKKAVTERLAA